MNLKLHANATTTPKIRADIQASSAPVSQLARELGVSETTVRRWRGRSTVQDRSHTPKRLMTSLTEVEEVLICELRSTVGLSLDDITEVMRRCVKANVSRSAVHRCLKRHSLNARSRPAAPKAGVFETATIGFIHIDLKHLPALNREKSYAFVAIDRASRFVYVEITKNRTAKTITACLQRFLKAFPDTVHTILTDNGSEFTDRFSDDKKGKPPGKPSGQHPFDIVCRDNAIQHRLTKPFKPQTNGMVERFNRRIAEALRTAPRANRNGGKNRFNTHAERNRFITNLVDTYNRTRLRCLKYKTPRQVLYNLTKHNTKAEDPVHIVAGELGDRRTAGWSGQTPDMSSVMASATAS